MDFSLKFYNVITGPKGTTPLYIRNSDKVPETVKKNYIYIVRFEHLFW